jgi:dTDP-4-dehydrorhamnose reductase
VLGRNECDITSLSAVTRCLEEHRPWAVVNAAGYTAVNAADSEPYECFCANTKGPAVLATACAREGNVPLVAFSSAFVFEGQAGARAPRPYVESAPVCPGSGVYARSKAAMEDLVSRALPKDALIIRSSALFDLATGNGRDFVTAALHQLAMGRTVYAAEDDYLTPAYLPDFADAVLDLLIDGARGIWHLGHPEPVSRSELVRRAAKAVGIDTANLRPVPSALLERGTKTPRPPIPSAAARNAGSGSGGNGIARWFVLASERTSPLLPPLEDALRRAAATAAGAAAVDEPESRATEQHAPEGYTAFARMRARPRVGTVL